MSEMQFQGTINIDVRESTPDWEPYAEPVAPEGAPNVLYFVWDDVGFSAMEPFGGLIETPNMRRIADQGLRYTQFHTTALCSPTRSCLLNGRNATSNGMACITEASTGFPGSNARIPFEHALLSEVLVERGWNTYAIGKWHLAPGEETNMASSKRHWPLGRGFERYYGFLGGESDQWYPDLIHDNHPEEQPYLPKDGYHLSKDLTDKAIRFIRDAKTVAPEKPWFMYFCPGAGHAPHHVWSEWADKYKGAFDMGYERYREIVFDRMKQMGIAPQGTELTPMNPLARMTGPSGEPFPASELVRPWDSLSEEEKTLFRRMAEVYAGFLSYTDHEVGRLLDYLEEAGQLENTIIVALSDNGASGEGGPDGSVNENKFFNGVPDSIEENIKYLDVLGSEKTYSHYALGWAMAFNTPNKMWKRWGSYEGGVADPFIISWPKGIQARGEIRQQYIHAIDIVPTLYECLGIQPPKVVKGYAQAPIEGVTFQQTFDDASAATNRETQFYVMLGTRGIWHKGWHASATHPPAPSSWGHFSADTWELYHLDEDRSQAKNVAAQYPEKLEELKNLWWVEAGRYNGLPLEDRTAVEILTTPRPQISKPRDRYVYYPDVADVPEAVAVNVRNRSYSILAEVELETPEAAGVLFAHGGRFGGHALYLMDGKLHYVYNWLGEVEQKITSSIDAPSGKSVLGVKFDKTGMDGAVPTGTATLYINHQEAGSAEIKTQLGNFSLVGEGLCVGRDGGQPVSSDYESPFRFVGGVIKQVIVDVSGEPYTDFEREVARVFARD
jgi:arylsulfatase